MQCLGELSVAMPETGAFPFMPRAILVRLPGIPWPGFTADLDRGAGFELYRRWILYAVWFPQVPVWVWCVVFCAIIFV